MINVVDEVLNTSATDNKVKYVITFDDGTVKTATIDLATPVTTAGTPLNKVLFDSIQNFLMTSTNPQSVSVTSASAQSGTTTQTASLTVAGRRYYLITSSYANCKLALYDAQANNFVFATYIGRYVDNSHNTFVTDTTPITLFQENNYSTASMSVSLSGTTLTLTFTKTSTGSTGQYIPSGTITVYELGGFII